MTTFIEKICELFYGKYHTTFFPNGNLRRKFNKFPKNDCGICVEYYPSGKKHKEYYVKSGKKKDFIKNIMKKVTFTLKQNIWMIN
jgi:antitoxin component YwqK of YwqJK toxin-antitoxin module